MQVCWKKGTLPSGVCTLSDKGWLNDKQQQLLVQRVLSRDTWAELEALSDLWFADGRSLCG